MRSKSPSFNFFPDDFLAGVMHLTFEERGVYITLLSVQHGHGHLSLEIIKRLIGGDVFERVWPMLSPKFAQDDGGGYFNQRLENEIQGKVEYSKTQSENGKKGGRPPKNQKANEKPNQKPNESETKAKQKLPIGIGMDMVVLESSDSNETTTIVNRGVKGGDGIVKHQPNDTPVTTQFYIAFVTAYGQFGRPVKRASIEQELHTALLNCIRQNPQWDLEAARSFLLMQAGRACDSDIANDNKARLNPDSWLRDRCYETPIDTSPPKRGPTQEEEIQRLIDLQERNSQNGR